MATYTTNLNLVKPGYADSADIADINANMDALDTAVAARLTAADLCYKNGDTFETTATTQFAGMCNNAGTGIVFSVPVPMSLKNISGISVATAKGIIYGLSGRVDSHNSSSYNWKGSYTVTAEKVGEYYVKVTITTGSSFTGCAANEPLIVSMQLELTMAA